MSDNDSHYSPLRRRLHEIIFEADTFAGALFDILLLVAIVCSITVLCLQTVPKIGSEYVGVVGDPAQTSHPPQTAPPVGTNPETDRFEPDHPGVSLSQNVRTPQMTQKFPGRYERELRILSWFFTILFTIEYLLRVYCVKRPINYVWSFWGVIDLLAFLPDYALLLPGISHATFHSRAFSVIRSLRLLRVFRVFRLGWFQSEADDLGNAIWKARAKIVVFLTVVMVIVTVVGTLMYEIENTNDASQFHSIPEGIYWAIVTMTTVGFGDIVPLTILGKFLSAALILIGYSLIIVPTGFVSAEIIEQRSRKRVHTTINCPTCVTEGHDVDAKYCKYCGDEL